MRHADGSCLIPGKIYPAPKQGNWQAIQPTIIYQLRTADWQTASQFWPQLAEFSNSVPNKDDRSSPIPNVIPFPAIATPKKQQPRVYFPSPQVKAKHLWLQLTKRYPFFEQQSATDCGVACLVMIGRYWGKSFSINRLRDLANVNRIGVSLRGLATASESIGFASRPVKASLDKLAQQPLPAIAHWEGNHYIVVYEISKKQVIVGDPAIADALRASNRLIKAEDTWKWLQKHHLDLEDFEQIAEINLLSLKLAAHLFAEKVEPYFYENQLNYLAAVTYEVVLEDEDLTWELFYAVTEGEITFQDVTRQHIQNPELRRTGGYRGIKNRHEFKPDIASAVFVANPPELLKPIVIAQKVHLIWVEEIIQPKLDQQLRINIISELFADWLKQQISQLEIIPHFASDSYSQPVQELLRIAS